MPLAGLCKTENDTRYNDSARSSQLSICLDISGTGHRPRPLCLFRLPDPFLQHHRSHLHLCLPRLNLLTVPMPFLGILVPSLDVVVLCLSPIPVPSLASLFGIPVCSAMACSCHCPDFGIPVPPPQVCRCDNHASQDHNITPLSRNHISWSIIWNCIGLLVSFV